MESYPIFCDHGVEWLLFSDSKLGFSCCPARIANVLKLVKQEFEQIFGSELVNSHSRLNVLYSLDGPTTFKSSNLIFLSSSCNYFIYHIYQFSHELCHFMVSEKVCTPFRWFEETLCELMSWVVLQRLSISNGLADFYDKSPSESINSYIVESQEKRTLFSPASVSQFISDNLPHLQEDCYDRSMNAAVAYELFSLFTQHPELWHIIPYLPDLSPEMSLQDAILHLCSAASIGSSEGEQFLHLLCQ